ncbi:MAG: tyrosine-type recombinase/integrase [Halobacteriota archaeon]
MHKPLSPACWQTTYLYTFRNSFAINLVRTGTDIRRVQLLSGHANLNAPQVYLQFRDSDLREAYDAVAL